ncbi:MAG: hypothetical protein CO113_09315 [Elusimicrobia bacterium CG_4_9_14_3_um_filter_62_55]|nr:MAG: hypothetical protein COR54_16870 [Elusimicrobia bacterium CG22_combo_CG10-13_8_21_14_all_63_91]PJA16704.1 MAG: hypothetical protein COX66_06970 [Elusimicrobia bacterium CG_4_10_14_0_2_um_filter_63_34]PJB25336.1 MAG: hypothetical protein CO113_09315 [Elusimicrobia bacterium CG_4_9_14_3_um_filter_62_55]
MSGRIEEFTVLCAIVPEGIDSEVNAILTPLIEQAKPDYWVLVQPESYILFFRTSKGGRTKSNAFQKSVRDLDLRNERVKDILFGEETGEMVVDMSWFGKVKDMPLGEVANFAEKKARGSSSRSGRRGTGAETNSAGGLA